MNRYTRTKRKLIVKHKEGKLKIAFSFRRASSDFQGRWGRGTMHMAMVVSASCRLAGHVDQVSSGATVGGVFGRMIAKCETTPPNGQLWLL